MIDRKQAVEIARAIGAVARANNCAVITDDLDLYIRLSHDDVTVFNFTHLQAQAGCL
jgi:hypothetical protein